MKTRFVAAMRLNGSTRKPLRGAILGAMLLAILASCTEIKAVSVTGSVASVKPGASPSPSDAASLSPTSQASPTAAPSAAPSGFSFPTPGPLGTTGAIPQPSFTPALIVTLDGRTDPGATTPRTPSPIPGVSASMMPGATSAATPSPGAAPSAPPTPTPPPPFTPITRLNTQTITNVTLGGYAVDAANNLWIGDTAAKAIKIFTLDGAIQGTFPITDKTHTDPPAALCFDTNGSMWVQTAGLSTLFEFGQTGTFIGTFDLAVPNAGGGQTLIPGMAPIAGGGIWVLNALGSNLVTRIDATGKPGTPIEAPGRVVAMASDAAGNVWLVISDTNIVLAKFSPAGTALGTFPLRDVLDDPRAIAVDNQGLVWVAGRKTPAGQPTQGAIAAFAGTGILTGTPGLIMTGVDRSPVSIAFDAQSNVVLADGPAPGLGGASHGHVGFMNVSRTGVVLAEQFYDAPDSVLTDRNGAFWGLNRTKEAIRFKL